MATGTFDDVTDPVKRRKNPIPDDRFHSNVINRLNFSINHQDLINIYVFELFQGFSFLDLSGPLSVIVGLYNERFQSILLIFTKTYVNKHTCA